MVQVPLEQVNAEAPGSNASVDIPQKIRGLRETFNQGHTRSLEWRTKQLKGIQQMLSENGTALKEALRKDVGKTELEAHLTEVAYIASEVDYALGHLKAWMKPDRVSTPVFTQPGTSRVYKDPLGVVLIISPWNYPFALVAGPLIGALCAGNAVAIKPSEIAQHTSSFLRHFLPRYLDAKSVAVIEGGIPETTQLLRERFDHIFYTGSGRVGKVVLEAAAKHLTPVTLELGGKSPCIVDASADLEVSARRILWGKFSNAGQTCVAPDYVLVEKSVERPLLEHFKKALGAFFGGDPQKSPDYGRVANLRHFQRLEKLLDSGDHVAGGDRNESDLYIAPTILTNVDPQSPVMADEIFGPILPVLPVQSVDEAIAFVNHRPKPLALYIFSARSDIQEDILGRTSSGGVTINHAWLHLAVPGLPFGGVGESGMGAYHGHHSFETFSHHKAVLKKPTRLDPSILYPPYTPSKQKWLKRLL